MNAAALRPGLLGRRSPPAAWEAAFLIGVFPGDGDLRWCKVQAFGGSRRGRHALAAVEGMDGPPTVVVVEGRRDRVVTTEVPLSTGDLAFAPGGWDVRGPGLVWRGAWPDLELILSPPDAGPSALRARTASRDLLWWARLPRVLGYWSAFGPLQWGDVAGVGLVERAWGADSRVDVARFARRPWHWDVLAFPDGSACAGLALDAGAGLRGVRSGGRAPGGDAATGRGVRIRVHERRDDDGRSAPEGWSGALRLGRGTLVYEAVASTPVAPLVPGGGFVGFGFEGEWRPPRGPARAVSGAGFTEFGGRPLRQGAGVRGTNQSMTGRRTSRRPR